MQKEYWKKEFQYNGEKLKKQKDSKVMCSLDIWGEKDLHTNPKVWDSWIHISQEKEGKCETFLNDRFLKIFALKYESIRSWKHGSPENIL